MLLTAHLRCLSFNFPDCNVKSKMDTSLNETRAARALRKMFLSTKNDILLNDLPSFGAHFKNLSLVKYCLSQSSNAFQRDVHFGAESNFKCS